MRAASTLLAGLLVVGTAAAQTVPYPTGWRDWKHVKSMTINAGHPLHAAFGGTHHLYANPQALKGYAAGTFPDGSVIAFDLLDAIDKDNAVTEGNRKILGVMVKDAKLYAATGGWGFEGFKGGDAAQRAVGPNAKSACFDCHTAQKGQDYVFSKLRP